MLQTNEKSLKGDIKIVSNAIKNISKIKYS